MSLFLSSEAEYDTKHVTYPAAASSTTAAASMSATTSTSPAGTFNDADVTFLQMMYPHHEQAVQMAELVPARRVRLRERLAVRTQAVQLVRDGDDGEAMIRAVVHVPIPDGCCPEPF